MQLGPGERAPAFAVPDQTGNVVRLSDFEGRRLLLYFYPAAETPGCTAQSCSVRDAQPDLQSLGTEVVGVSPDTTDAQRKFAESHALKFPLLADVDHDLAEAYGVWGEHTVSNITYEGVLRSAFLIDESGKIIGAWYGVSPQDTVPNAKSALGRLQAAPAALGVDGDD